VYRNEEPVETVTVSVRVKIVQVYRNEEPVETVTVSVRVRKIRKM
jgi:hypothetical protein